MKGKLLGTAAILSGGAGVVDGFGNFNLTLNYIDGFFNAASQVQLPADQHERDIWVGDKHACRRCARLWSPRRRSDTAELLRG